MNCEKNICYIDDKHCIRCGAVTGPHAESSVDEGCDVCSGKRLYFDTVLSFASYDGVVKSLIHKFKYAKQKFLLRVLNDIVMNRKEIEERIYDVDIIVPVPLYWAKKLRRGFNQSELLSLVAQRLFSKPIIKNTLCRVKNTAAQTQLSKTQRRMNVKNAFFIKRPELFNGKRILLIDDVLTTGATASECARKLKEAGAKSVHLFVFAVAEYHN